MKQQVSNTDQNDLYGIQILRGIAALAVVTHHSLEMSDGAKFKFSPDWLTTSGASGVDIFFVISGFIMLYISFPTDRPPTSSIGFLARRAIRIYPFYWICCLVMLTVLASGFLKHDRIGSHDRFVSLFLFPSQNHLIGVSWTLVYEMFFYVLFAAALYIRSAIKAAGFVTVAILASIGSAYLLPNGSVMQVFLENPISIEFCMGVWLGVSFRKFEHWPIKSLGSYFLLVFGFGATALAPLFIYHSSTAGLPGLLRVAGWGLPALILVAGFLQLGSPKTSFGRIMILLGNSSYALYLTHVFVMIGYGWLIKSTIVGNCDQVFCVPLVVIGAVLIGIFSYQYVEQPILISSRRLMARVYEPYKGDAERPTI